MTSERALRVSDRLQEHPDLLAIGHVAKDLEPGGYRVGGAVTYAALTARGMGLSPAVVTSVGPDLDPAGSLPGIRVHAVPASETTTFRNTYHGGRRVQVLSGVASALVSQDVPVGWRSAPLVMLGPLAGEVSDELARSFPNATVVASVQGWLRRLDEEGRVTPAEWDGDAVLPHVDAAVVSRDDLGERSWLDRWKELVPVLIVTAGGEGSSVHFQGRWHDVAPFAARDEDPTGAGDVFGAAYLIRYRETGDVLQSARFASCVASFCVEADGTQGIPTRAQVEARLSGHLGS